MHGEEPSGSDPRALAAALRSRGRLGLLLDFDGTVSAIVPDPSAATFLPRARRALEALLARGDRVAILSGRATGDIATRAAMPGAWYSGCHGAEVIDPEGRRTALFDGLVARAALERFVPLAYELARPHRALVEDKGLAVAIHLRDLDKVARAHLVHALTQAAAQIAGDATLNRLLGRDVFEVRPPEANKARAAHYVLGHWGPVTPVAAGDDLTDEDTFLAANQAGGVTIKVGQGPTRATARIADPAELEVLLEALVERSI